MLQLISLVVFVRPVKKSQENALDVIEIDAASNTGVDNIRELIERAQFAPVQCRYKVYVIDECLTGDTLVLTRKGLIRIDDVNLKGEEALSYNEKTQIWEYKEISGWVNRGQREILRIKTQNCEIRCTSNHLIRTEAGWMPARNIQEGMRILSPVPVAAEISSIRMEQMDDYGDSAKVQESNQSKAIGNDTPISGNMDFGKLAPKNISSHQDIFLVKSLDSSIAHYWEMPQSPIPMLIVDTHDSLGLMENHNKTGCSTKLKSSHSYNLNLEQLRIEDTDKLPAAIPFATRSLWTFSKSSSLTELESKSPKSGCKELPQKGWLGGTSMMAHSALVRQAPRRFKFTQKDSQSQKINDLQNGSLTWDIPPVARSIKEQQQNCDTTTFGWEQIHLENGLLTYNSSPAQQWITNLERVESVCPGGVEFVYDIEVEDNHNFVANGLSVHNCHMLTSASFNALLKTLEEPPEQVVFILATTDPQRVLPTIISRCQRFDFRRIPIDDMTQHLSMIAAKEQIPIAEDALYLIAQISQGGLRDAESLLDQLSLLSGDITVERVWDLVGAVPERDLMALIEAIAQNHPEAVLDTTRRLMDRGREPLIVLQNLASFYRDLLIAKTAPDRGDLVALTSSTWAQLCEFAKGMSIGTILAGQQRLKESEIQLKNSTQPRLWLEVTLMGLFASAIPPVTESEFQSISLPVAQPKPIASVSAPQISEAPQPVEELVSEEETDLDRLWQTIINNLQPLGTQALLKQQGSLLSFDGEVAQIGVAQKLLGLAQGRSKNIAAALTKTFGKEIKFSLVVAPTTPSISAPPAEPSEPNSETTSNREITPPVLPAEPSVEPTSEELPQELYIRPDWDDDEVTRAAKNLAEAFNGSVVDADEAEIEPLEASDELLSSDIAPLDDTIEDDDDDTEF